MKFGSFCLEMTRIFVDSDSGDEAEKFQPEYLLHGEENADDVSIEDARSGDACSEHENEENESADKRSPLVRSRKKAAQSWNAQLFSVSIDTDET